LRSRRGEAVSSICQVGRHSKKNSLITTST
jgi:hypothetical protein